MSRFHQQSTHSHSAFSFAGEFSRLAEQCLKLPPHFQQNKQHWMCVSCDRGGPQTGNSTGVVYRTSGHRDVCSRVASLTRRQSGLRGDRHISGSKVWATGKIKYFMLGDYTSLVFLPCRYLHTHPTSEELKTTQRRRTWLEFCPFS